MLTKRTKTATLSCLAVSAIFLMAIYINLFENSAVSFRVSTVQPTHFSTNIKPKGIIYNRVGKCGSRSMIVLMTTLAKRNHFQLMNRTTNLDFSGKLKLTLLQQLEFVMSIEKLKPPFVYFTHLHFVDFRRFGAVQPIFINLIRDPLSRLVSAYYFNRFGDGRDRTWTFQGAPEALNMSFDECVLKNYSECTSPHRIFYIIPYFCGQSIGHRLSQEKALRQAKINVDAKYLVVGLLEEIDDFVRALEKLLPQIFKGAYEVWRNPDAAELLKRKTTKTKHKEIPSPKVVAIMKERLKLEYKFYNYVKLKFHILKKELGISKAEM